MLQQTYARCSRLFVYVRQLMALPKALPGGGIGLLRLDALGDYLLFRPYIPYFRRKNIPFIFICNAKVLPLAQLLDSGHIDCFLPIDLDLFKTSPGYSQEILRRLRGLNLDILLNPVWSRTFSSDIAALATGAPLRAAWRGNYVNQSFFGPLLSNRCYNKIVISPNKTEIFESSRHCLWLKLTEDETVTERLSEDLNQYAQSGPYDRTPVFFLGASASWRRLPALKIAKVVEHMAKLTAKPVTLAGGDDARDLAGQVLQVLSPAVKTKVNNFAGQSSLPQLISLVASTPLMVSHDSLAAHIAAACNTSCLVLADGSRYGRFWPYPQRLAPRTQVIYPPAFPSSWPPERLAQRFSSESGLRVADIPVEQIWAVLNNLLKN
ncbi:MAG: glycosyltransferase family 9 protein [Desulfarculales bacterium]|jgi:ADP-heptose:LPS heptosyltransferase|nr:glycosyltransferase family 9 protein [Desulfarculales bacterium]